MHLLYNCFEMKIDKCNNGVIEWLLPCSISVFLFFSFFLFSFTYVECMDFVLCSVTEKLVVNLWPLLYGRHCSGLTSPVEPAGVSSLPAHLHSVHPAVPLSHNRSEPLTSSSCFTSHMKISHTEREVVNWDQQVNFTVFPLHLPKQTHTHRHLTHTLKNLCGGEAPDQPRLLTHWLTLKSVWPLEPDLPKSNQYVNSVISVKSITTPFTQKPERGAFHSSSPYLWHEIQILYDEGEKHRRDAGWGLSSS